MYYNPESYDILPFYHNYTPDGSWVYTAYFIPSYIGAVTERGTDANLVERQLLDNRGYCLWQNYKEQLDVDRSKITSPKALIDHCAEYCYTAEEAFSLEGDNKFNKVIIAEQLTKIRALKQCPPIESGYFSFVFKNNGERKVTGLNVTDVIWKKVAEGKVKILEHPLWVKTGDDNEKVEPSELNNLYVAGIDGIDIGQEETSAETYDASDFCMAIKRRMYGMKTPRYVAIYKDRPEKISEAYTTAIALAMYYNCKINIEATRLSFLTWARSNYFLNYFMKRPSASYSDITKRKVNQYGTPATPAVIDHQNDLIRDYIDEFGEDIWFEEMLTQLNSYTVEAKRKYDIVVAMGRICSCKIPQNR